MARRRATKTRRRIGKVSYYLYRGSWHLYYREHGRQIRRKAGDTEEAAAVAAAQVNAQLSASAPTLFSFTPLSVAQLQQQFLDHHEHVLRSSLATISRYRTATRHLVNFADQAGRTRAAHELDAEQFVRYLRTIRVAPNGHARSACRPLRDKGIRFILETCRSLYGYAAKKRHMPPYADNPFAGLGGKRFRIEDAKPVFVFDEESELAFLKACDRWSFPIHFTLAKTGLRVGELVHLLVEDLDLEGGWLHVRNKPQLGWRIKTGRERRVPLVDEVAFVLRQVVGDRVAGPVFHRERFDEATCQLARFGRAALEREVERRCGRAEAQADEPLSRSERARICRRVWRETGVVNADRIRQSFIHLASEVDHAEATCPKSWRHTLATLLQDANVDPLVRQLTLGHVTAGTATGVLGMTAIYTHTRPDTQRREIDRALRLWPRSLKLARRWSSRADLPVAVEAGVSARRRN